MLSHPDVQTWGFFTRPSATFHPKVLSSEGYNVNALKPLHSYHELVPFAKRATPYNLTAAKAVIPVLNKHTKYNVNSLKRAPGSHRTEPLPKPWSKEWAISQLQKTASTLPLDTEEESLEDKIKFLIEADKKNGIWKNYLGVLQSINRYAAAYPMTEEMKSELVMIQEAVLKRYAKARSMEDPFDPIGMPERAYDIANPIVDALKDLGPNPTADEIADAIGIATSLKELLKINADLAAAAAESKSPMQSRRGSESESPVQSRRGSEDTAPTEIAPTLVMEPSGIPGAIPGDEKEDIPEEEPLTQKDLKEIKKNNTVGNKSSKNIKLEVWKHVATIAGINPNLNKEMLVEAVLKRPNDPIVNTFLNLIKAGTLKKESTATDYQRILDDSNMPGSAVP